MSQPRFIFNTIGYQNSAITVNNYVNDYNAKNNAAATGNSFKFQTDADRMKYLLGSKGQSRVSGYYPGLYASIYALTVAQDGNTKPSINGPPATGWGNRLWSGPILDAINISDQFLQNRTSRSDYLGVEIAGYVYSEGASTLRLNIISDDGVMVYLNNEQIIPLASWSYQGPTPINSAVIPIAAGYSPIRILYFEGSGGSQLTVNFSIGNTRLENLGCGCFYNYKQM